MVNWVEIGSKAIELLVLPAIVVIVHLWVKVEVMSKLSEEKKQTINTVVAGHTDHENRITVMETVIRELHGLAPELKKILETQADLRVLASTSEQRLRIMELKVFGKELDTH